MQWVDAMRGFSMLIVVLGHVLLSMGIRGYDGVLSSILLTFRMPLFFFVSGFFSFRAIDWWNKSRVADILKRKVQAQIICTICFFSLFQLVFSGTISLYHGFGGYWFTIVLFQMYVIYLGVSLLSRLIRMDIVIPALVVIAMSFIGILLFYDRSAWIWEFLCWENLTKYMQFFVFGLVCSKYRNKFFRYLSNNMVTTVMIIGWIACMLLWYNEKFQLSFPLAYSILHDIIVRYCSLIVVIMMFYASQNVLEKDSTNCKILKLIGRRTLDIYMIHYFLLPDLSFMTPWISPNNMFIIQLTISSAVTIAIVAICLMISSILRRSSTLECWLFGVKSKPHSLAVK